MKEQEPMWKHGEYEITYDERESAFVVGLGEDKELAKRPTLEQARAYCDGREKRLETAGKKKMEKIPAYHRKYGGAPTPCTITSFTEKRYGVFCAWIVNDKGERDMVRINNLYLRSAASQPLIAEAAKLTSEANAMHAKAEEILKKLPRVAEPKEV